MYQDPSTGDPTRPSADPSLPLNPLNPSPVSPAQTPPIDASYLLMQERRIRDLQSAADKQREAAERTLKELERERAEKVEANQKIAELEATASTIVKGAAQTAQEYIARMHEMERKAQEREAQAMKATALLAHPELREYAALIPATTDETLLQTTIETLQSARQRDLDTVKTELQSQQQQPLAPPATSPAPQMPESPLGMYPRNQLPYNLPSASPARPAANGAGNMQTFNEQLDQKLKEAIKSGDPRDFERVYNELGAQAEAQLRQQYGAGR